LACAATLVVVAAADAAEGPTRAEYVAQLEPICQHDSATTKRVLEGVQDKVRNGKLSPAGGQFIHASKVFGATIGKIVAVPRPPADDARLVRWFGFLRLVKGRLWKIGKAFKEGDRVKATHESIQAERSGNAANNVSFVFGFHYCRLTPSRYR
jgi:hypothetical protein